MLEGKLILLILVLLAHNFIHALLLPIPLPLVGLLLAVRPFGDWKTDPRSFPRRSRFFTKWSSPTVEFLLLARSTAAAIPINFMETSRNSAVSCYISGFKVQSQQPDMDSQSVADIMILLVNREFF